MIASIFYFTWDIMEQFTFILSMVPIVISLLYLLFTEKTINPLRYLKIQKEKYLEQTYKEFDFELAKLYENEVEITNLEVEIDKLKKASR